MEIRLFSLLRPVVILILVPGLSSCKILQRVNDFSNGATASLGNYEKINSSMTEAYVFNVRQRQYHHYDSPAIALQQDTPRAYPDFTMTLSAARQTDSAIEKIYLALNAYFSGLAKLSADSVAKYSIDTVTNPLSGGSLLDTSIIKPGTISAIGALSTKLGAAITAEYRIHHVENYVIDADPLVQSLIYRLGAALASIEGNLHGLDILLPKTYQSLLDRCRSPWERKAVIDQYYEVLSMLQNKESQIEAYIRGLKIIADAHAYIKLHIHELNAKEVKKDLAEFTTKLKNAAAQFNEIKNLKY